MISKNIMNIGKYNDAVFYKINCACHAEEDVMWFELELDDVDINLNFYKTIYWKSYDNFFVRNWKKFKVILSIIFTGEFQLEDSFLINNQNIDGFIEALQEGKKYIGEKLGG